MVLLSAQGTPIEKPAEPIITDMKTLRKMSKPTTWDHIKEIDLIERLKASIKTAWTPGVGLAAVQIGEYLRVVWFMDPEGKDIVLVNPVIIKATDMIIVPKEGCLSIPDVWSQTKRYHNIEVRFSQEGLKEAQTLAFKGFPAIVIQHEVDHLNGVLNLSRRYIPKPVVGRNELCPCKSGKKYKKCCIDKLQQPGQPELKPVGEKDETERSTDSEKRRKGLGEMFGFGKGRGRDNRS